MNIHDLLPTHRCTKCNAFWRYQLKRDTSFEQDSWTLKSPQCGTDCCDNKAMGPQIVPITFEDLAKFVGSTPHLAAGVGMPSTQIEATLAERGKRYGEYRDHARITQSLKRVMQAEKSYHDKLTDDQRETLDMIAHKIGRILNGDPNYHDSWHDIVGYSKLSADEILLRQNADAG